MKKHLSIAEFDYDLPEEKIAQKPLDNRQDSKLLVYNKGSVLHRNFEGIGEVLPEGSLLVFNNTRVIPARIYVYKETGARIQVFLLNPVKPFPEVERALEIDAGPVIWECMIGNAKRWKEGERIQLNLEGLEVSLRLVSKEQRLVEFNWAGLPFCDLIEAIGKMPLPPYIRRDAGIEDESRYQTVFARNEGAVAAPTAGLHFTDHIISGLRQNGIKTTELTLHVGAGTFKPVEVDNIWEHDMHEEYFQVGLDTIRSLKENQERIATGTTSLRTLETLYWVGIKLRSDLQNPWSIEQDFAYSFSGEKCSYEEALDAIEVYCVSHGMDKVVGKSGIMIVPGYQIRSVCGLITNFHLPKSTLLMLISALVGDDWKRIYDEALKNNYRFLSYGDSSVLLV